MINKSLLNERLTRMIAEFAETAMQARQVAKRLNSLLPSRYREIHREHARRREGHAERLALTDPRYVQYLDELAEIGGRAAEARVQYETHAMLYKARQSLRTVRR